MKYCSTCGSQINDECLICPTCGCSTELGKEKLTATTTKKSSAALVCGILAVVFGALGGWLGVLFGILNLVLDKTKKYRALGIIGIVLFAVWIVIFLFSL
ncbi:MAG: hypothetical protein IKB70_09130 [Bacilli bacterium]|nr:hypothetical protein [Bacilli bacterium]